MINPVKSNPQKKTIVIDARLYGTRHTGLGRYTKNLLIGLKKSPDFKKFKFILLVYPELKNEIVKDLGESFTYIITNFRHYSVGEQIHLPILLYRLRPHLAHFTHLDKPIFYFGKSLVTVHDLIRHFSKGTETSTRNALFYWPKYLAYLLMTKVIFSTSYLIVPSNFWRDYIIKKYKYPPQKIVTTYEAVDPKFLHLKQPVSLVPKNYLIYTGNLYPHKNITVLLKALQKIPDLKLKLICARSFFSQKIEKLISTYHLQKRVQFLGYVPDKKFPHLYQNALALIHPSLLEGFSLTGLEAMALSCPVIASNSSCMPEVYEDSALYFDPNDPSELANQIKLLKSSPPLRQKLITLGKKQVAKYSWSKTAQETINFYQKIIN